MIVSKRVQAEIDMGLSELKSPRAHAALRPIVETIAGEAWRRWIRANGPEHNHPHHEVCVFRLGMKIAVAEKLSLSDMAVLAAFAFCHDNYKFKRIMDARVREAEERGLTAAAEAMRRRKHQQRVQHMTEGARRADEVLAGLRHPGEPARALLTAAQRRRCSGIIAKHDCWKLGEAWPLWKDRLAVCCFEADALWPLQPLGVLADVERSKEDLANPGVWQRKVVESHGTLLVFRANWAGMKEPFRDRNSIFRTREGHRIYRDWCKFWGLPA